MFIHNIIYYKTAVNSVSQTMRFITPGEPNNNCHTLNFQHLQCASQTQHECISAVLKQTWSPAPDTLGMSTLNTFVLSCGKVI